MNSDNYQAIDLTHSLSSDIPSWDGGCGFILAMDIDYPDCTAPNIFRTQKITMNAGMGTHIDAPAHCFEGAQTIDALGIDCLIADCVVIRTDDSPDENYVIMPDMVEKFEKQNGPIQKKTFVIFSTGWSRYWNDPEKYRNKLVFPSVHESTARLLAGRDIAGLGIDTLSADAKGEDFPVHRVILGAGKYLVENIANAESLPPTGAKIFVLPMKIKGATEAPIRLVALVPKK